MVAAAPTPGGSTAPEPTPDIKLGGSGPALTETLDRALDRLAEESAANQRLRETVATLEHALAEKEGMIDDLTGELSTCDAKIAQMEDALEQWKKDVLGFRSEMRDYEEAQIQVLQEIAVLLKGFKKEQEAL
jgi:chromosome segregation ATPase